MKVKVLKWKMIKEFICLRKLRLSADHVLGRRCYWTNIL